MNEWFINKIKIVCKDTKEECIGYNNYLKSNHWKNLRNKMLIENNYKCQKCRKTKEKYELQIHHKSYKNIGHEHKKDLVLLCKECHKKKHKEKDKTKRQKNKKIKKINKNECKYNEYNKCKLFNCKCFDCKEYKRNNNYLNDKIMTRL